MITSRAASAEQICSADKARVRPQLGGDDRQWVVGLESRQRCAQPSQVAGRQAYAAAQRD